MKSTLCNIPEDLLIRQLQIESIPQIILVLGLIIIAVITMLWYIAARDKITPVYSKTALIAWFIIFFPLFWKITPMFVTIGTNIFNPEYAAIKMFTNGCPSSIK